MFTTCCVAFCITVAIFVISFVFHGLLVLQPTMISMKTYSSHGYYHLSALEFV